MTDPTDRIAELEVEVKRLRKTKRAALTRAGKAKKALKMVCWSLWGREPRNAELEYQISDPSN